MNAVSLFAGIGGIDLGFQRAGIDVVAGVEIDKAAQGVLRHRFSGMRMFSDVCEVTGNEFMDAGFDPRNGVLAGGFPCQDVSKAGRRAGLAGERSGLFWHIVRIAEETCPQYVVIENVPGLLSSNSGRDMGTVIGALADIGYGVAWRVLDAQFFGIPQRRRRLFIVGCAGDDGSRAGQILDLEGGRSGDRGARFSAGERTADPESSSSGTDWYVKARRAASKTDFDTWRYEPVSPTINTFDNACGTRATVLIVQDGVVRRLTPRECERLQGFPDDWTAVRVDPKKGLISQADGPRYRQLGNAVAVPVAEWIGRKIMQIHHAGS